MIHRFLNSCTAGRTALSRLPGIRDEIISADERLAELRGVKALIVGPSGVGKTSLLRTVDQRETLFLDIEAGDLSVLDVPVDTLRVDDWPTARDIACRIGGPNPSYAPTACYLQAHCDDVGGALDNLDRYDTLFVDSITAVSRLSYRWSEQQPEAFSERTGKKDTRAAYGLHAREMIAWLNQLQHARGMNVILVGILERVTDEFSMVDMAVADARAQKPSRELPGIVDEWSPCSGSTSATAMRSAPSYQFLLIAWLGMKTIIQRDRIRHPNRKRES